MRLNICEIYSNVVLKHIISIVISAFMLGYKGKTTNFESNSDNHRTTIAHFLNNGKWDSQKLEDILKSTVLSIIYNEAKESGKPIYCFADDTIASKTKPSSKALHPIEDAYFHQSHLKKKQDYGHQAVSVMLSCNGKTLNYAFVMYNKTMSKIAILKSIIEELPVTPVVSYFLCDSWYTSIDIMKAFLEKGFYTIGALKTNRVIYPLGIKQQIKEFTAYIHKTDTNVSLVTVGKRKYFVYRYEGKINGIDDVVVLISYPQEAFGESKALRAFISTDISLHTEEILEKYLIRWEIEVFFRQVKNVLAMDKYQIRKSTGIRRYWLIMSLVHFICSTAFSDCTSFESGYNYISNEIKTERIRYIYNCGKNKIPFSDVINFVA